MTTIERQITAVTPDYPGADHGRMDFISLRDGVPIGSGYDYGNFAYVISFGERWTSDWNLSLQYGFPYRKSDAELAAEQAAQAVLIREQEQLLAKSTMLQSGTAQWTSQGAYDTALAETQGGIAAFNEKIQSGITIFNDKTAAIKEAAKGFAYTPVFIILVLLLIIAFITKRR